MYIDEIVNGYVEDGMDYELIQERLEDMGFTAFEIAGALDRLWDTCSQRFIE